MNAPEKNIHKAAGAPSATADTQIPTSSCADTAANYLSCCSDTFGQLTAILQCIVDAAADEKPLSASHILALGQAGRYIANDFENTADCWRKEFERKVVKGA